MPLTDPLILAADVSITPVSLLSAHLRKHLKAQSGDSAITRLRGRAPAKLISRDGAVLLEQFREARLVAEAVRRCAAKLDTTPERLLQDAFPLLRDCYNSRFLVSADSEDAAPTLPTRARGDAVGRYRVLRCLQVLDDTELYQVKDTDGSLAALKLARPGIADAAYFRREAAALQHLEGLRSPQLRNTGRHRGRPWLAMSWCEGVTPDVVCREWRDRDDRNRLLEVIRSTVTAYVQMHERGVLHGDVHLGNILIDSQGAVHLLDLGLAHPIAPLRLPGNSTTGGVLQYFAPEQAVALRSGLRLPQPTAASEQYALGVALYVMCTGRWPINHSLDRSTALDQIINQEPMTFASSGVPPWPALERVIQRSLAKNPEERFATVAELSAALASASALRPSRRYAASPLDPATAERVVDAFLARVDLGMRTLTRAGRAPRASVMLGRAGTAYALYRIALARNDARVLALANVWIDQTERECSTPRAFDSPSDGLDFDGLGPVSPFHSITGVHLVRGLMSLATGDIPSAAAAANAFVSVAQAPWQRRDLTLGRMGVPLAAALMLEPMPATLQPQRAALLRVGREYLGALWTELDSLGPIGSPGDLEDHGAAHGWAGMIWATLRWHQATGDPLPPSLLERLSELASRAEPLGRGVHWAQRVTGSAPSVLATHQIAGWCNGPTGFVSLFALAGLHFKEQSFQTLAELSAWSAWEAPSEVFDLCCGHAGRAYALLSLYRHTGDSVWLHRAEQLALRAFQQFDVARPRLPRPLSLFKGEAGLAVLAADLAAPERAAFPIVESEGFPLAHDDG